MYLLHQNQDRNNVTSKAQASRESAEVLGPAGKVSQWKMMYCLQHTFFGWELGGGNVFLNLFIFLFFFNLFFLKFYLFIYLFLAVLGLRFVRGPSPAAASGGHSSSRCGDRSSSRCAGLSPSRPPPAAGHRLQTRRLSSRGSRAQPLRGMWDPPRPGPEPAPPAPAGRLPTTAPPGKPFN